MTAKIEPFECHWPASRKLAWLVGVGFSLAASAPWFSVLPPWACLALDTLLLAQLAWAWPRLVSLAHPAALTGLRHDADGWWLFSRAEGWQRAQLYPDSLALPVLIILRVRPSGYRWRQTLLIPADALDAQAHRRLRLRLKFSRRRWAAAE